MSFFKDKKWRDNLREIILDTETTGLNYATGDRLTEIGCVELIDKIPTGNVYQTYINPEREVSKEAQEICGLPSEFFYDKPKFKEIVDDFLKFIGDSTLVIHNAKFDIGFLNSELKRVNKPLISMDNVVDTLLIARKKFPGAPASLDALCKRFDVSLEKREKHGALIDCWLLSEVYIHMLGGKQSILSFGVLTEQDKAVKKKQIAAVRKARDFRASAEEIKNHEEMLANLDNAMWPKLVNAS